MDSLYGVEDEDECEYIHQSALNDNVYVYMARQDSTRATPPASRAVSYLEIFAEKREHVYEYIEYDQTVQQKKKYTLSWLIKRSLLSICVLMAIIALIVLIIFLTRLMDRWQREKASLMMKSDDDDDEDIKGEIIFKLNISLPEERADFIRNMTKEAWNAYVEHAWPSGALKPLTKEGDDSTTVGETIVASMSTLWVMDLSEEFERGKQWVEGELHQLRNTTFDVLVNTIIVNYLGGLLSCFALTGDEHFINKSYEITDMLLPALNYSMTNGMQMM